MANKRMFTLTVVNTDAFLEMPCSTQALYFHLCMRADDDGFVASPKIITRTVGASEDDLKLLVAKRFVLVFEDGVIVIKHWRMHNTLSVGRYKETAYLEHKALLKLKPNNAYSLNEGEPLEDSRLVELGKRQVKRIDEQKTNKRRTIDEQKTNTDKRRIDKNRIEENSIDKNRVEEDSIGEYEGEEHLPQIDYSLIVRLFNEICVSYPKVKGLSEDDKKNIRDRLKTYTLEDFRELFELAENSDFLKGDNDSGWRATFDWLIEDDSMAKVLNGKYEYKISRKSKNAQDLDNELATGDMWLEARKRMESEGFDS